MTWIDAAPAFVSALGFGILPGLALALLLGLRGMALLGSAPAFSITSIALASVVAPWLGMDWGILPVVLTVIALAVVISAIRLTWHRWHPHPPVPQDPLRLLTWATVGVTFAAVAIGLRFASIIGDPENVSQTYDAIFHLNAVQYVLDSANASSLTLGGLTNNAPGEGTFYPAVWHALTSLVAQSSAASIPVSVNVVAIVIGAVFWPLGCVFLVRQVAGPRALAMVAAAVLSAAFGAFPFLMIDFGVLYPYFLGLSLLPAGLAYALLASRIAVQPNMRPSRSRLALLGVLPGIALAHPSVLMILAALFAPVGLVLFNRERVRLRIEKAPLPRVVALYILTATVYAVAAVTWFILRIDVSWYPEATVPQAIGELLLNAPVGQPAAWAVTFFAVVGAWSVARDPARRWVLYIWIVAAGLYLIAAAVPYYLVRIVTIGLFYADPFRLAALLPLAVLPLAVIGLLRVHDHLVERVRSSGSPRFAPAVSIGIAAIALLTTQGPAVQWAAVEASDQYVADDEAPLLTQDELEVLSAVERYVPEDVTVAGNPWTGASLVYALSDRRALLPHVSGFDTPQTNLLAQELDRAHENPAVCEAADDLGVEYVLDFGLREVHFMTHEFPGFTGLDLSEAVELVYESGDAGLYRLTACD